MLSQHSSAKNVYQQTDLQLYTRVSTRGVPFIHDHQNVYHQCQQRVQSTMTEHPCFTIKLYENKKKVILLLCIFLSIDSLVMMLFHFIQLDHFVCLFSTTSSGYAEQVNDRYSSTRLTIANSLGHEYVVSSAFSKDQLNSLDH